MAVAVGLDRWPAVRAWLSNTHVPLASLQLTAADGRAAQQVILCSRSRFLAGADTTCRVLSSVMPDDAIAATLLTQGIDFYQLSCHVLLSSSSNSLLPCRSCSS